MRKFAEFIASVCAAVFNLLREVKVLDKGLIFIYERLKPVSTVVIRGARGRQLVLSTPNELTLWRAESYFTKEPETLEWIDSFGEGSVFYDIGANVGLYSLYAATKENVKSVYSFEPEASNYALLNQNVYLNSLDGKITCLNIAVSNSPGVGYLYLAMMKAGGAMHNFGTSLDFQKEKMESPFKQGAVSYTVDGFIEQFNPPFPNHIKVDVDGLEKDIIVGARKTLADKRMLSVLIEINEKLPEDLEIIKLLESLGYKVRYKKHSEMFDNGPYANLYNYVFDRS